MVVTRTTNGVDVGRLYGTIDAIKADPGIAEFRFRAHHQWVDGAHSRSTIKDFYGAGSEDTSRPDTFTLEADEPGVLLGEDHGPNATEMVLAALATCLDATLIYHAAARGIRIDELEIDMEGKLDLHGFLGLSEDVRNGFEHISATFRIRSDASEEQLKELVELAQQHSPVFDIVTNPVPVTVRMEAVSS